MLAKIGACPAQVTIVREHWPNGGRLCVPTLQKAARLGLDVPWLAHQLPPPLWDAYDKARAPLRDAYNKACASLWDAYDKAHASALYGVLPPAPEDTD